ncbi:hypothetical protein TI04_10755 [Achromatium sp. WMS2]|nr:hypothetical protein TI04_10755 [Achromatium sp. WMS2]
MAPRPWSLVSWMPILAIHMLLWLLGSGCSSTPNIPDLGKVPNFGPAVGAHYYECHFEDPTSARTHSASKIPPQLNNFKFATNFHNSIAFRNDQGPARPLQLIVDETGDMILIDHIPGKSLTVLTMGKGGRTILSRHILGVNPAYPTKYPDLQMQGTCFETWGLANNSQQLPLVGTYDNGT